MSSPPLGEVYRDRFARYVSQVERCAEDRVLPALSTQRRFALIAEGTGRRVSTPVFFRLPSNTLSGELLASALRSVALGQGALMSRVAFDHGIAVQRWCPQLWPDTAARTVGDPDELVEQVRRLLLDFEGSRISAPVAARVLAGRGEDLLALVFDHACVDEISLRLVLVDLARVIASGAGDEPVAEAAWRAYSGAVRRQFEHELAASRGGRVAYWTDKLRPLVTRSAGAAPGPTTGTEAATAGAPPVALEPRWEHRRRWLFPILVAACHRALRDVCGRDLTSVGYAWGGRVSGISDVVGCFMNTVVSVDSADSWPDPGVGLERFLASWLDDLDHADVPFDEVVAVTGRDSRSQWRGCCDALLVFEDLDRRAPLVLAGQPASEWLSPVGVPKASVSAAARLGGSRLDLRVIYDISLVDPNAAEELTAAWRSWFVRLVNL